MNENDTYIYVITALLPLAACMVVTQVNPYNALIIRGILGAVAAMLYAILGAPDVALTEALVGTMLAITLYAVAVRSSLVMRVGVLKDELPQTDDNSPSASHFDQLLDELRRIFRKRQMRLEVVPYPDTETLHQALMDKEVHATCVPPEPADPDQATSEDEKSYHTAIRVKRIYDIMQSELALPSTSLTYVNTADSGEKQP
jgi:putative multicomponent Na+:H+ antiporter subunit B